jgi:hypothetical protein
MKTKTKGLEPIVSVRIGPFTYYFVNPKAAAEVILASVSPDSLSLEGR